MAGEARPLIAVAALRPYPSRRHEQATTDSARLSTQQGPETGTQHERYNVSILGWIYVVLIGLSVASLVYQVSLIGKPRKPITSSQVGAQVVVSAVFITLYVVTISELTR